MQDRTAGKSPQTEEKQTLVDLTPPKPSPQAAAEVVATVPSAAPINYRKLSPNFPINDGKLTTAEDISVFINFEAAPSKETIEKLTELGLDITFVPGRKILTGDLKKDANIGAILEVAEVKRIAQSQQFSPPTDPTARHPASPL